MKSNSCLLEKAEGLVSEMEVVVLREIMQGTVEMRLVVEEEEEVETPCCQTPKR